MPAKVTIQDIADALGVSRNTVSKAINNTGVLADSTRDRVLKKAAEMGYKQFSYITVSDSAKPTLSLSSPKEKSEIALFTANFVGSSHFASPMLDKFQRELSQLGYSLTLHRILPDEINNLELPGSFIKERTAGIACVEMFNYRYSKMLCSLDIPILFIDSPVIGLDEPLEADRLYMDNTSNIYLFVKEMVSRGKTRIGFIGQYLHCQSFFERYIGFRDAMYLSGLTCQEEYCIINNKEAIQNPSSSDYREYLTDKIQQLEQLPDVFICANDFIALDVMQVLKELGYSVPQDVYLCGFDDSPESRIITPSLTTIHIHSQIIGAAAVQLLVSRIDEPSLDYRIMHTETDLIYRESTGDQTKNRA